MLERWRVARSILRVEMRSVPNTEAPVEFRYRLEGLIAVLRITVEAVDGGWCALVSTIDERAPFHSTGRRGSLADAISAAEAFMGRRFRGATLTRERA